MATHKALARVGRSGTKPALEKDIQRTICEWLAFKGFLFWRSNNIPVWGRSNDGHMRFRAQSKYTPKGLPDIMVVHQGKFIGMEVKQPGRKLRPEQAEFGARLAIAGGSYHMVTSLEEAQRIFA